MRRSCIRTERVALAKILTKVYLEVDKQVLASMFHFDNKRSISRMIHSVRKAMMSNFVQKYLGFHHIRRQTVIDHYMTDVAAELFLDSTHQLAVVMDATYLYVQKSTKNEFQRRSYSLHKCRNLVKVIQNYFLATLKTLRLAFIVAYDHY